MMPEVQQVRRGSWWLEERESLLDIAEEHPNAYVYHTATVRAAATRLLELTALSRVLYAMKANFNRELLRVLADAGIDFDCVSPGEVRHLREALGHDCRSRILFTPNFAPRDEYVWGVREGVRVTLDNLFPLRQWPEIFRDQDIMVRIDPGQGQGHHEHVNTGGDQSKFGVPLHQVDELERLVASAGARVVGIHSHSGSGILDVDNWERVAHALAAVGDRFEHAAVLDLGGGIGVADRPGDSEFDVDELGRQLEAFANDHPRYKLWLEPGRFLVAEAGVLLTQVTQVKGKGDNRYIGVNTGMNALIRPALYGAYHHIVNLSRLDDPVTGPATVVGPICESGDKLGADRLLPDCEEGDVILIANAGAYGQVMSSHYNLRDVPPEIVL